MKIIGKDSLSQYISYFIFVLFIILVGKSIYEQIGYWVSYYNYSNHSYILSTFFVIGNDVGWEINKFTSKYDDVMKFKFYIPFTTQNLITGIFNLGTYINNTVRDLFLVGFFYTGYKSFKEISSDKVFNLNAILWLKRFGWLNIIFSILILFISIFHLNIFGTSDLYTFYFLFFGVFILFIVEFFKKGYDLQSENDLTI